MRLRTFVIVSLAVTLLAVALDARQRPQNREPRVRARDVGITVGTYPPGPNNAITDVPGVLVGHSTIIRGSGKLHVGQGPVRTGVTAVLPRKDVWSQNVFAATHTLNGNGEMTGIHKVRDFETLGSPILITNTGSVGAVYKATYDYMRDRRPGEPWSYLPLVAETWDGSLNDLEGQHIGDEQVFDAIDGASGGVVPEGNVGGGTGMICYEFKGGIGTASRRVPDNEGGYMVGALVQANFGRRAQLTIDGVAVGREISDLKPTSAKTGENSQREGSVIVVIGTNAPLSSRQLERLAQRASLGLARTGSVSGNSSGDIFIAFSSANVIPAKSDKSVHQIDYLSVDHIDPLFQAVVESVEESVLNALSKADTMTGIDDRTVYALPYDRVKAIMQKYGRLR